VARHPRFVVTDLEKQMGTRTTAETLRGLKPLLRRGHFVWIMGADGFAGLHRWHDWLEIPETLPLAVLARPGSSLRGAGRNRRHALRGSPAAAASRAAAGHRTPARLVLHSDAAPARKLDRDPPQQPRRPEGRPPRLTGST
jgi:nicotinate-nucleotide adenylyltransferase